MGSDRAELAGGGQVIYEAWRWYQVGVTKWA